MYTECPSCKTFFKITPNQLKAAGGKVRCGSCDEVFSALDGLVDVVPEDAVAQAQNNREANSASAPVEKSEQDNVEAAEPKAALSEAEQTGGDPLSDVPLPENNAVAEEDIESALKSAVVEERNTEAEVSNADSKREEINNDIDAALDGLFDGDTKMVGADTVAVSKPVSGAVSELSAISDLDEVQNLDLGDGDKAKKKDVTSSLSGFDAPLSESLTRGSGIPDDISSLSEFERELEQVSAAPIESEPLAESSFDLGGSFLDSDAVGSESKATKKTETKEDDSGSRKSDSYIFEEIEGKKKGDSGGSGVVAKVAWMFVILALLVVLLGQFAYLKRQDLVMYPEAKPIIEKLCAKLNAFYPCDITAAKDVKAIELLERNVVSHPNAKNALLITSTIENKAEFDQAYPNLVLTFSDINQKIIAKRKFTPVEYLSKEVNIDDGMKKSVPVKIMLEIVDPGEEAVNFEFSFQ